jgi:RimJ/RimL family protein N-acetyltransferase
VNVRTSAPSPRPDADGTDSAADAAGRDACWLREPQREDMDTIEAWFAQPTINQWFDFGLGRQQLSALALHLMLHSNRHRILMFGCAGHEMASGLVAVSDIPHAFGTGSFWVLRDASRPAYSGMTCDASTRILHDTFKRYEMHCITAWAVQNNVRSRRLLERIGFRRIGMQRACHRIGDKLRARVLYDLTAADLLCKAPRS